MIRISLISLLVALPGTGIAEVVEAVDVAKPDLLRFTNGDQLHGSFQGIKAGPSVVWRRDDIEVPVELKSEKLRQVVLRGGRPLESHASLGHVALINGDRIPGVVTGFDEATVTVSTTFAGDLRIPRAQVGMIAPSPLGGRVRYHGPFVEDEWEMTNANFPDGIKPVAGDDAAVVDGADAVVDVEEEPTEEFEDGADLEVAEAPPLWNFAGAAWYWNHREAGTTLIRREGMPDRAILRCQLAWRNRLSLGIAFHADFARPAKQEGDDANVRRIGPGEASAYPRLFGNSYVLHMYSSYVILYRCGFNEKGAPLIERIQAASTNIRLPESGSATLELRCNRLTGEISLFIDDDFAIQWSEGGGEVGDAPPKAYAGKGPGFGFMVQTENSPVRISDIVVAEWNGMPDSARSLQVDDQDIVLLANGTDRFSGKVLGYEDGKYLLEGRYGEFRFPAVDVAEIRFARNGLAKPEEITAADEVHIQLYPIGRLSGRPIRGDATTLTLATTYAGEFPVALDSAIMLDFNPSTSFLDDWDSQF